MHNFANVLLVLRKSLSPSIPKVFIAGPTAYMIGVSEVGQMANARLVGLKAFVQFLEEKCGFTFDVNSFHHRIKLQKYVFIATFLGWDKGYDYNIYVRGPYSPDLAKDYYNLNDVSVSSDDSMETLSTFDKDRFIKIVQGKKIPWLEVGATMLSLYNNNKDKASEDVVISFLLSRTKSIKSNYDDDGFIEHVLADLTDYNLIGSA